MLASRRGHQQQRARRDGVPGSQAERAEVKTGVVDSAPCSRARFAPFVLFTGGRFGRANIAKGRRQGGWQSLHVAFRAFEEAEQAGRVGSMCTRASRRRKRRSPAVGSITRCSEAWPAAICSLRWRQTFVSSSATSARGCRRPTGGHHRVRRPELAAVATTQRPSRFRRTWAAAPKGRSTRGWSGSGVATMLIGSTTKSASCRRTAPRRR